MDNMHSLPISVRFSSSSPPNEYDDQLRLAKALVDNGSDILKELLELQSKGWNDESAEKHFQKQRQTSDNPPPELTMIWFRMMKGLLREIDTRLKCIPAKAPTDFLDLGCCPGGFSSYILDKNPNANGTGVSLPVADGGHEFSLEEHHHSRFNLFSANLTYYQLGPTIIDNGRLQVLPFDIITGSFDVVLLDGHQLRTQRSALPWDYDRLLISQLILGLQSVKDGGTIIMKLPMPHKPVSARILYLFNIISSRTLRWKPNLMHANRGTFYAVAKGVGKGQGGHKIPIILGALKALWVNLTFGGEEGSGRYMVPEDLDFLISMDDLVSHHLDWLTKLGTPLWKVQKAALEKFYDGKHIK
ncbi:hypothetical protein M413DRAFT_197953 [Hebeloma cylindrosporum]|uniref:Ribosomal RNA methyltransferase FtsJ domain-containing protein n=1 Tax=Hebeloma cylindrosporum TaxID=76867 RepID=A0A0C3BRN5_HEBCY|nr:hypothetical protein M413DRAFT_197953 [Hebeloma cylindrosporum h7]